MRKFLTDAAFAVMHSGSGAAGDLSPSFPLVRRRRSRGRNVPIKTVLCATFVRPKP